MKQQTILILLVSFMFATMLTITGLIEYDLKRLPHLILFIYGALTLFFLLFRVPYVSTLFFYLLLGLMLFICIGLLFDWVIHTINPDIGYSVNTITGERHKVMDMTWVFDSLLSIIFTPILIIAYHRKKLRIRSIELSVCIAFIALNLCYYLFKPY